MLWNGLDAERDPTMCLQSLHVWSDAAGGTKINRTGLSLTSLTKGEEVLWRSFTIKGQSPTLAVGSPVRRCLTMCSVKANGRESVHEALVGIVFEQI
jgi:hypothetical protein